MQKHDPYLDDEIDLKELFQVLLEGKKLIILITAIADLPEGVARANMFSLCLFI